MKKRVFFLCIIVGILIFLMSASACAETGGTCGDNLTWTLDDNGTLTISGTGAMEDYGYGKAPWPRSITSIVFDGTVTSIGDWAFHSCYGLTSVTIPNSVKSIGNDAFNYCSSLTSVTIQNGVTSIGDEAFESCTGLTSVTIPGSVTSIGIGAFDSCTGLTSVTIPDSVTSIGRDAFWHCFSLTKITVSEGNTSFCSIDGVLFNKEETELIAYPAGLSGSYTIPGSVTSIGIGAFESCIGLTSVEIPGSVETIGDWAFFLCEKLMGVVIPGSVTSIGQGAFCDCDNLMSVTIPDGVTSIGISSFSSCENLTSVTIPSSVTSIGDEAFESCTGLTSVTIQESVTNIGDYAFNYCTSLKDVYYSGTEAQRGIISISIGNESLINATWHYSAAEEYSLLCENGSHGQLSASAYYDNQYHTEKIRAGETVSISVQAYEGYLPTRPVVTAANGALVAVYDNGSDSLYFNGNLYPEDTCRRYSFIMPASDVTISETFQVSETCRKVTANADIQHGTVLFHKNLWNSSGRIHFSVTEPHSLVVIGMNPDAGYIFDAVNSKITIKGKSGTDYSKSVMISADGQAAFPMPDEDVTVSVSFVEAPSSGTCGENITWSIENGVLYLTGSGEMSDTATARNAWQAKKEEITSLVIGEGITGIGNECFSLLDKVASASLPSTLKTIDFYSFYGCTALSSVAFPEGLESIGTEAFYNTDLTSVFIPKSVHEIGSGAFDCRNLSGINVDSENSAYCDVEGILFTKDRKTLLQYPFAKPGAFYEVPEEVEAIEYSAFGAPRYLKTLFIHDSIKSISTGQSYFSTTVKQIDFEGTEEEWNSACRNPYFDAYRGITINYNRHRETINDYSVSVPEAMSDKVTITAPSGGWVVGENTFSASADKPCVLAVSYDGGQTYSKLTATANGDGTYSFDVNITDENTIIVCAYKGDANGDGDLNSGDVSRLNAGILHKADMSPLDALACDVNGDGELSSGDISRLNAAILKKVQLSW